MSKNEVYKKRFIILAVFILVVFVVHYLGLASYISIKNIKQNRLLLETYIRYNYFESVLIYISMYIFLTSFALPVAFIMAMAGGFLFGTFKGALYASIGATIGSSIAFLIVRYLIGNWIHDRFGKRLKKFNKELKKYGYSYLLSIHFVSVIPLFLINIFAGLANVSVWTFFWTTFIGVIPGTLVYAFAGRQFNRIDTYRDILSWHVLLAFAGLVVLAILPIVLKKRMRRKNGVDYI